MDRRVEDKMRVLLVAFREAATLVIASIEDYLGTPHDESVLFKRRRKVERYGRQETSGQRT